MAFPPVPFQIYPVTSRLAFGSAPQTAADVNALVTMGYTHVLDLRAETPDASSLYRGTNVVYHRDPMIDDGRNQPSSVYEDGVMFVAGALRDPNAKIYIHCHAGQYRSPSMMYAVLRSAGYAPQDAWNLITRARSDASTEYVSSAEASVPNLPRIDPTSLGTISSAGGGISLGGIAIAALIAGGVWWLGNYYIERQG